MGNTIKGKKGCVDSVAKKIPQPTSDWGKQEQGQGCALFDHQFYMVFFAIHDYLKLMHTTWQCWQLHFLTTRKDGKGLFQQLAAEEVGHHQLCT